MTLLLAFAQVLLVLASVPLAVAAAIFALQVAAARTRPDPLDALPSPLPPLAVLIPAHDEAEGIAATLESLRAQLGPADRMLVVADNCSDDTAAVARGCGAAVVERHDATRRGKSYALEFGVRHLALDPPALVVLIDADCQLEPGALERLAAACTRHQRPVQAAYLMRAQPGARPAKKVAEFAWAVKNLLRPLGWRRLGLGCQLTGSGMLFPWALLRDAPLANGHIVEDLQLGLDLALAGHPPLFCPEATVTSVFAENAAGEQAQRTRWEHGHLALIGSHGPRLLWRAIVRRDVTLLTLALDLCVPPLSLLVMLGLACAGVGALVWSLAGAALPWAVGLAPLAILAGAVPLAWVKAGRDILPPRAVAHVFWYLLAKLPLYLRFLVRRQVDWVASARDRR